jgi:hypothetical protein
MKRYTSFTILVVLSATRTALAEGGATPPELPPLASPPVSPVALVAPPPSPSGSSASTGSPGVAGKRVAGGILMGVGAITLGAATYLGVSQESHTTQPGAWEITPAVIGAGFAGATMAMVGAFLWLSAPQAPAQVSLVPSGLVLAGSF